MDITVNAAVEAEGRVHPFLIMTVSVELKCPCYIISIQSCKRAVAEWEGAGKCDCIGGVTPRRRLLSYQTQSRYASWAEKH